MSAPATSETVTVVDVFESFVVDLVRAAMRRIEAERSDQPETSGPGLLNREDAAAYLAIGTTTLDALRDSGALKPVTIPGMKWPKYVKKDLDRYIDRLRKEN